MRMPRHLHRDSLHVHLDRHRKRQLILSAGFVSLCVGSIIAPHLSGHITVAGTFFNLLWIWE